MGREEHWKSSIHRRFCCVLCASSSLPTCRPYPGHVEALSNASTARGTKRIWVHKYHAVRHDQREQSTVSTHDEDETYAGVRRPARHEARLHHQEHQRSAIGAPPRHSINMLRMDSAVLQHTADLEARLERERGTLCARFKKRGRQRAELPSAIEQRRSCCAACGVSA